MINGVSYFFRIAAVDGALQVSGFSNEVSATPAADVAPPNIELISVAVQDSGQAIVITANITDDSGVANATLNYHRAGIAGFTAASFVPSGNIYQGSIPATAVTSRGVEYYIAARDQNGLTANSDTISLQVRVNNELKGSPQPGGDEQTAYRLISVPLDLEDKSPRSVLEDDLGRYDIFKWRCYEVRADQTRAEYPNISDITPGKAIWLIVKEQGKVIDTGVGLSNRTDKNYSIVLHPMWNLVANPFNFRVPLGNLSLKSSGLPPELRTYTGSWNNPVTETVTEMQPFQGYAIFNSLSSVDTLFVNPDLSSSRNALLKETTFDRLQNISWSIQIVAQCQQALDSDNLAAVSSAAFKEWDESDYPEPPVIGEYVSVYFPHPGWRCLSDIYCTDVRPEPPDGEVWEFEVKTNIRDVVQLRFDGIETVPQNFEVWLVDDALKISHNLREPEQSSVAMAGAQHPKQLKLVVGRSNFVEGKLIAAQQVPASYELFQNFPNPFNPVTTIRYGMPGDERVTLKVYNVLGEEVLTVVNDEYKPAGYHVAIWNGKNKEGKAVASGVYFIRMQVQSVVRTRKMVLIDSIK